MLESWLLLIACVATVSVPIKTNHIGYLFHTRKTNITTSKASVVQAAVVMV